MNMNEDDNFLCYTSYATVTRDEYVKRTKILKQPRLKDELQKTRKKMSFLLEDSLFLNLSGFSFISLLGAFFYTSALLHFESFFKLFPSDDFLSMLE